MYWIAFGDIHEQTGMLGHIPGLREAQGVLLTGDLTNRGTTQAIREVYDDVAAFNPNIQAVIGNMDTDEVSSFLDRRGANLHLKAMNLFPELDRPRVGAIGVGYSTPTPFNTPNEVSEDQLAQWLDQAWELTMPYDYIVAVIHNPPYKSTTDDLGGGSHVGSKAVLDFIKKNKPIICITGHIHESKSVDTIGSTTVINTGMLAHGGYAVIEASGNKVTASLNQVR
ncbi:MAG: metallophosphoesterase [Proteobacteria bacterium]|nr:metallophosphoesterase [Pseudomonadota bacterium]MBU1610852.1 metallophosphoesterase [Pseudomonadota bacterium]